MGTWIVGALVLFLVGLAARKVYKDRKSGAGCGCGCKGCSASGGDGRCASMSVKAGAPNEKRSR